MMGDNDVTLAEQLECATDINACFCVSCGQPDEPQLHDPARCPAQGGTRDNVTVAEALAIFDRSCEQEPELCDEGRALHCAMLGVDATLKARDAEIEGLRGALENNATVLGQFVERLTTRTEGDTIFGGEDYGIISPIPYALGQAALDAGNRARTALSTERTQP